MKVEHTEVNMFVKIVQWLVNIFLFLFCILGSYGILLGPVWLLLGLISLFNGPNNTSYTYLVVGIVLVCVGLLNGFVWTRKTTNPLSDPFDSIDSWFKRNFGHKVIKEIPDKDNVKSYSGTTNYSSVKREEKHYSGSYKTSVQPRTIEDKKQLFKDYINNEIEKISYNNTLEDKRDKEAATFIAVNNVRHSPDVIASIYNISIDKANEIEESITVDEEKKVANHISYEGRIGTKDKNKMKSLLGYRCAACGKDMSEIYGNIGHNYIELHHLVPYSEMKENETRTLTEHEFCVLCPDCHRMIHKLPDASDIDMLIRIIRLNKK